MPPLWRPAPVTGKQPPLVLLRGMEEMADTGDGTSWPTLLALPIDAGVRSFACGVVWGWNAANEPALAGPDH